MNTAPDHPWNMAAQGWHQHAVLVRDWLQDITPAMLDSAGIAPGSRVLDIAAGAGGQTLDIAHRVGAQGYVLATDISPKVLALAQESVRAAGLTQVETRLADAQAMDLAGSNFDAAVCRLGLMFCTSPLDALNRVRKALKPGGQFSAVVFSLPQKNPGITIMMSTALKAAGLSPKPPFEPGGLLSLGKPGLLTQLLVGSGFVDIQVKALSAPFCVPTAQHYIDFVRSSGSPIMAILAPLSTQAQDDAWHDIAEQLHVFTTSSGWVLPNELLLCSAASPP